MFDDIKNSNSKEPEDIFSGVKETVPPNIQNQPTQPMPIKSSVQEKPPLGTPAPSVTSAPSSRQVPRSPNAGVDERQSLGRTIIEEPKKSWARLLVIVVVIVVIVGAGAWIALRYSLFKPKPKEPEKKIEATEEEIEVFSPTTPTPEVKAPVDSDGDGLTDEEELLLGTDALLPDSDADGLPDKDEVKIYKTDPLDSDTDKDGYFDGEEVQNGYDPKGKGRLYEVPAPGETQ